MNDSMTNKIV